MPVRTRAAKRKAKQQAIERAEKSARKSAGTPREVVHLPEVQRFSVPIIAADVEVSAFVEYVMEHDDSVMNMVHTFVPPEGRGKGLAGVVCKAAFEYCREHNLKIKPQCSYISGRFVPRHPEFANLIFSD